MISKKWIAYGTAGLIGLSVIGGTAAASAAATGEPLNLERPRPGS